MHNLNDLCIWQHGIIGACNVEVALVELSEPALVHRGLVSTVHLRDVEPLYLVDSFQSHVPGERHC